MYSTSYASSFSLSLHSLSCPEFSLFRHFSLFLPPCHALKILLLFSTDWALPTGNTQNKVRCITSERNMDPSTEDSTIDVGENAVADGAHIASPNPHSGGLKAWLFVLATFFMFISA